MFNQPQSRWMRWLGPLSGPIDRFLSGSMPSDPLYLSNRTAGQKVRRAALIALPFVVIGVLVWGALTNALLKTSKQQAEPSQAEIAARTLPGLARNLPVESNSDVQVVEASIRAENGKRMVVGTARNNTVRRIGSAELNFDLMDSNLAQVGAVSTTVRDLSPNASVRFEFPVKQSGAVFVIVRDVRAL